MGAPSSGMTAIEPVAAESLSGSFKTIDAAELRKHEAVLDYWSSIRGDREYPALHDLDPLEISDAGPCSLLLELLSGGEDAEIRHCGETLRDHVSGERIADAPRSSISACIAKKLSLVAISRNFLAFEDEFTAAGVKTRCWITLLPLSAAGAWVDYVYALVSFETAAKQDAETVDQTVEPIEAAAKEPNDSAEPVQLDEAVEDPAIEEPVAEAQETDVSDHVEEPAEAAETAEPVEGTAAGAPEEPAPKAVAGLGKAGPGFSKLLEDLASLGGFYKTHAEKAGLTFPGDPPADEEPLDLEPEQRAQEPDVAEPAEEPIVVEEPKEQLAADAPAEVAFSESAKGPTAAEEPAAPPASEEPKQPAPVMEGTLQTKLADVRAKADEARMAKLKANSALYEGLSAAYDFALDAEGAPEEYLKLVEAQGLKIQLRSPMKPVVKLAFNGLCDDSTITQLEAVLAWALEQELPRGSLAGRIEEVGGIGPILNGEAQAA
jgi:hypothetical protein